MMTAVDVRLKCLELAQTGQVPGSQFSAEAMVEVAKKFEEYVTGQKSGTKK